jgi:RNA polymerase sigma factor (sigma-70 family)
MGRGTLEELHKRAIRIAYIYGQGHCAEDFASSFILRVLEGKSRHQLLRHALLDYLDREERPMNRLKLLLSQIQDPAKEFTQEDKVILFDIIKKHASPLEEKLLHLYLIEGYRLHEIGKLYGISEARISQRFSELKSKCLRRDKKTQKRSDC